MSTPGSTAPTAPDAGVAVPDWTRGGRGVALQRCAGCAHVWYFRRAFCPACGRADPVAFAAAGTGIVHAATVVHRAPDDTFRALAPYGLVLVELDEGPRMMAHAPIDVSIGERVSLGWRDVAGRALPFFERSAP
ncbi:MAG: hypothetical protein RJA99_1780 [Pseudomonadota bacterium]|jgi:uncharacterized OB-fold protein